MIRSRSTSGPTTCASTPTGARRRRRAARQYDGLGGSALRTAPTGIVVQCQNERSQHKNKASALKMLKSRLYDHEMKKKQKEMDKLEASKVGHQLRQPDPQLRSGAVSACERRAHQARAG